VLLSLLVLLLAFEGPDVEGRWFDLAAQPGQVVVLEWVNPDCPPWRVYYDPPFMQPMQQKYPVVWVWVCSKPGVTGAELRACARELGASPDYILRDPTGRLAREFRPPCTPFVAVVRDGITCYRGAIDDGESVNYLGEALDAVLAGKPVERAETRPFG